MQLPLAKSLCASSLVHGVLLAAFVGLWVVPQYRARGVDRPRDVHLELAQIEQVEFAPPAPPEPIEFLEPIGESEIIPKTLEFNPPPLPIEEPSFRRVDFEAPPVLDQPFQVQRARPEVKPNEVKAPDPQPKPEPPQAATQEPVGDPDPVIASPTPVHTPKPEYPARAVRRGIEGAVLLLLLVDEQGRVTEAKVTKSSGSSLLDRSALGAVETWRFKPGTRDGVAIPRELPWRLVFSLGS